MNNKTILKTLSWLLAGVVVAISVIAWHQTRGVNFFSSIYTTFPLLGLLAFGLMWTHYAVGALRRLLKLKKEDNSFFMSATSIIVLFLILLHPGLLIYQLFQDGYGLPPGSYLTVYGAGGLKIYLLLGTLGFVTFMLFELHRFFSKKSWWKYVNYAQIAAMIAIFLHGRGLGSETKGAWFQYVWWFYLVSLILFLIYTYYYDYRQAAKDKVVK